MGGGWSETLGFVGFWRIGDHRVAAPGWSSAMYRWETRVAGWFGSFWDGAGLRQVHAVGQGGLAVR